jgi:serine/threonine protein phosphatase PrpC
MINNILERMQTVYATHKWLRIAACIALLLGAILLLSIGGGFPPWAWRFLFQALPRLPNLWAAHGLLTLIPLLGLTLLSATLLFAWAALVLIGVRLVRGWGQERRELKRFNAELLEAQYQSEAMQETQEDLDARHCSTASELAASSPPVGIANAPTIYPRSSPFSQRDISLAHTLVMQRDRVKMHGNLSPQSEPNITEYWRPAVGQSRAKTRSRDPLYLDIGTGLDAGIKRKGRPNEDSLLAVENITNFATAPRPVGLFIIADGMGGHGNGREASQLALRAMRESVLMALQPGVEDDTFPELLVEAVQSANRSVYKRNQQQHADMGTTITASLLWGATAYVANVGDSRTYLYRESEGLIQVTQDHSTVARLVKRGAIKADDVYTHPQRNEIYRSLGNYPTVEVDTFTAPVQVGDILLLCSDGLWEMVRDSGIEEILSTSASSSSQLCSMLVQAALDAGGKDNISVIAVCMRED